MDLEKALKKTKKKRSTVQSAAKPKPYTAVAERPYDNDLAPAVPPPAQHSSTSVVLALLSCFAQDAMEEARTRATDALTKIRQQIVRRLARR